MHWTEGLMRRTKRCREAEVSTGRKGRREGGREER
jgi:hypothetical protein